MQDDTVAAKTWKNSVFSQEEARHAENYRKDIQFQINTR